MAHYLVSAFKSCKTGPLQYRSDRKQSPAPPTLVLEMKPDSVCGNQWKRSSRTAGLIPKDPGANRLLLFRSVLEEKHNICDWQLTIKPLLTPGEPEERFPVMRNPTLTYPFGSGRTLSNKGDHERQIGESPQSKNRN